MKPITDLATSLAVTFGLLLALAFLAASVPVSTAAESGEVALAAGSAPEAEAEVTGLLVEITHVRNEQGQVLVIVFDDGDAFENEDYERAAAYVEVAAQAGTVEAHFSELRKGPYAVTLFHDENGDYDFNWEGLYPLEGYGISGARNAYHEPTFEEAAVGAGRVSVRAHYLN